VRALDGAHVRRGPFASLLACLCAVTLLGASTNALPQPTVVVYPLTQTGGMAADAGSNIAILLATKLEQLGGITIKPYTAGTLRPQYLENALKEDADYYITGFLTPVGSEISMISQVVSTHSGSVVFSTTIAARTYADAAGQADLLHDAILRHAGRGLAALDAPPPPPSSTPEPSANSGGVNILKALGHHEKSTAAPSPAPSGATASPPPATVHARTLVVEVGGDGDAGTRTSLGLDFSKALSRRGYPSGYLAVAESEVHAHAKELCAANAGTHALLVSSLAVGHSPGTDVTLDVTAYDCAGTALGRQRVVATGSGRGALAEALHRAALSAADAIVKAGLGVKPAA
jgi:hypothetical protein